MIYEKILFLLFLVFCFFSSVDLLSQYPIILIVSYDAFRNEYLSRGVTPTLNKIKKSGTFTSHMNNVFVTKTFPNHHSIATGVYPEFHGVLGNSVYDSLYKKKLGYSYEFWHYTDEVLPIWIANQKKGEGRHSGIMMWPGNEYEYSGTKPTHQKAWNNTVSFEQRVDGVIEWILNPTKPANLVLLYIEEPDNGGHALGIESPKFLDNIKHMDNLTKYLLDRLQYYNLTNHVNVFFLSDHGMVNTNKKQVIDLRKFVSSEFYDVYEGSPGIHIYPKPGKANTVYNALKEAVNSGLPFKVYKNSEIPDHWHFKNNRRAPPILALANPPHVFHDFYPFVEQIQEQFNVTVGDNTPIGVHGYDNAFAEMKPYFLAVGPLIKKNYKIEPFNTVDLFSLWAHISGFPEYAERTNGSLKIVSKMLVETKSSNPSPTNIGIFFDILVVGTVINITIYFIYKKWYSRRKPFISRFMEESSDSRQRLLESDEET